MKEAPNQKVQEKKPLLKLKNTKKYMCMTAPTPSTTQAPQGRVAPEYIGRRQCRLG